MCRTTSLQQKAFCFHSPLNFKKRKKKVFGKPLIFSIVLICIGVTNVLSQELHTHSNAVSIDNEANSCDGWVGSATKTADTSDPHHGTYAMKIVSTSVLTDNRRASYSFTATIGETYDISIWAKAGTQTLDPAFASWTGVTGFTDPTIISTDGTWAEYTFTVTATTTSPVIRVYTGSSSGSVGDAVFVDSVSIVPHVPESGSVWTEIAGIASYDGEVGIGTSSVPTGYKLAVEGKVRAREIRVDQDAWPDYVFAGDYLLPTLEEIQNYIEEKGHLPNIPSAEEVEANGLELGMMNKLLLEKIEQLMLYTIKQQHQLEQQQVQIEELQKQVLAINEY